MATLASVEISNWQNQRMGNGKLCKWRILQMPNFANAKFCDWQSQQITNLAYSKWQIQQLANLAIDEFCISQILQQANYATDEFSKWQILPMANWGEFSKCPISNFKIQQIKQSCRRYRLNRVRKSVKMLPGDLEFANF